MRAKFGRRLREIAASSVLNSLSEPQTGQSRPFRCLKAASSELALLWTRRIRPFLRKDRGGGRLAPPSWRIDLRHQVQMLRLHRDRRRRAGEYDGDAPIVMGPGSRCPAWRLHRGRSACPAWLVSPFASAKALARPAWRKLRRSAFRTVSCATFWRSPQPVLSRMSCVPAPRSFARRSA